MDEIQDNRSDAEKYMAQMGDQDVLVPSGATFRIAGMCAMEYGEMLGAIPNLFTVNPGESEDEVEVRRRETIRKNVYERVACTPGHGLVDSKTKSVTPIPYEKIQWNDARTICDNSIQRGGLGTSRAEQTRRSLPE